MYTATKVTLIGLGLAVAGAVTAQAQSNSIQATAAVQQPITVTAVRDLTFGNVFPGVPKSVTLISATAGKFSVAGQGNALVSMSFVVPSDLDFSGNLLPITWSGSWNGTDDPAGAGFTPGAGATAATFSGAGALFVYVGATVTPSITQVAGNYAGTVQLTVTY
jgi:uncharacterized protein DUF4402